MYPIPQPNWEKKFPLYNKKITFLSNPTIIQLNEDPTFQFFSQDILLKMLKLSYFS